MTLIGDEPYEPYDRIPLSKQMLTGWVPAQRTTLPRSGDLDADWRLGQPAVGLDRRGKRVLLADGDQAAFDRLLIATRVRASRGPAPPDAKLDGGTRSAIATTPPDVAAVAAGPGHVLVIGAGFIGSEVLPTAVSSS